MTRAACFALCALLGTAVPAAAASGTADMVARRIAQDGAKQAVAALQKNKTWPRVIAGISSGNAAWVALTPRLAEGTDAGTSEELDYALSLALLRNAPAVLALPAGTFPAERICVVPYIEPTDAQVKSFVARADRALGAVKGGKLAAPRDACLKSLHAR